MEAPTEVPRERFLRQMDRLLKRFPGVRVQFGTHYVGAMYGEDGGGVQLDPNEVVLQHLEVAERGSGIGSAFMSAMTKVADHLGIIIWLLAVPLNRAENIPSGRRRLFAFYERFGFVVMDETEGLDDPNEWIQMVRRPTVQ